MESNHFWRSDIATEKTHELKKFSHYDYFVTKTGSTMREIGGKLLSETLKTNTTLTELDLSGKYKRNKQDK